MSDLSRKITQLNTTKQRLVAEETILMRKALESDNPDDLVKAMKYYDQKTAPQRAIKSFFVDPTAPNVHNGWLQSSQTINSYTLRRMANTPIIKSIIETRVEEVADFLEPQADKYSTGFIIRKKGKYFKGDDEEKLTKEDQQKIQLLTEFLLKGYMDKSLEDVCEGGLMDWGRKTVKDTLVLDKMATELIWNRAKTVPMGYVPIDAATIFYADNYNQDGTVNTGINKLPKFVQVYDDVIVNEYMNEELMWGVRNGQTSIYSNGYGESELEVLMATITAMLQGDAYNANIFKVGSMPAGIFRVQGNINEARLREFQSQWQSELAGYNNRGKMAFIEADKMEFTDMSKSNRDMEYSKYQEYLIKVACAVYKISPEEIGFSVEGAGRSSMFQDSGKEKIKYSRDKGLKPLLTFLQSKINKNLIQRIAPEFEFVFVGIEMETEEKELEMAMKKASSFKGLKEVRRERGLSDTIDEDDIILNPVYIQAMQLKMQQEQMKMAGNPESDQFMQDEESTNPFEKSWNDEQNPMAKDLQDFVKKELID